MQSLKGWEKDQNEKPFPPTFHVCPSAGSALNDLCGELLGLLATVMHEGKQWEIRAETYDEKDYIKVL